MLKPEEVALAAFLHDIGKFYWPACEKRRPDEVNNWLGDLPIKDGRSTHLHAAYSAAFVSQYVGSDELAATVARHHKPSTKEDWIVAAADRLASGERSLAPEEITIIEAGQARLASVFSEGTYCPLLRRSQAAAPEAGESFHPDSSARHQPEEMSQAWDSFINDLKAIGRPILEPAIWLEVVREHACRLPAQSPTLKGHYQPDISLFDHSRMAAALAHVLAISDLNDRQIESLAQGSAKDQELFSLVLGDLSGLQAFLYTGSSDQAVRALKGRSFFLQYLTESLSLKVQEKLGLLPFAEVFVGGGRFCLIASAKEKIEPIRQEIEALLLDLFGGELSLSLAKGGFGPEDLTAEKGGMGEVFQKVNNEVNLEKRRRFRSVAVKEYAKVFGPQPAQAECPVCHAPVTGPKDTECFCQP